MKQDISSILNLDGGKITFHGSSAFEPVFFCGMEYHFAGEVRIEGEIVNLSGEFLLRAEVCGKVGADCARCGKPVEQDFSFTMEEKLIRGSGRETEEDAVCFEGTVIDIGDLAVNNFLVNAPMRYLCREDCKGICPVCGKDRNVEPCSCEDTDMDPRFDILNQL